MKHSIVVFRAVVSIFTITLFSCESRKTSNLVQTNEQEDVAEQCLMGNNYANGIGVSQDLTEAVKWFRKAADKGHAEAQNALGRCYYKGEGVPKDSAIAAKWYLKAADQGVAAAQVRSRA